MKAYGFFLHESWSSLRRNLSASLAAVTAIGSVLFLFSLLMLLSHNILVLADELRERKGLSVFLQPGTSAERIEELVHHYRGFPEVREIHLVSRAEALRDLETELGEVGLADALGENPLPDVLLIRPSAQTSDAATLARLAQEIEAYEGVDDVLYGQRWVEALDRWLHMVYRANAITGVLAIIAIVLVLGNTLRLIVLMREEPIAILKMIGATDAFIRAPFVVVGVVLCLVAAVLSILLLQLGHLASGQLLPGLRFLPVPFLIYFFCGAGSVGIVGSLLTVELSIRHLERRRGRLRA